jgi:hypothetical protein
MEAEMTSTTSRRAVLVGAAALPVLGAPVAALTSAASAAAVAAPSIAALDHPERTAAEQLARVEQMIGWLRTSYICDGWKLDEAAADRVLRFFRTSVQFPTTHEHQPDYQDEWMFVISFINDHGQSFDWLLAGDVGGMICKGARRSSRATATALQAKRDAQKGRGPSLFDLYQLPFCDQSAPTDVGPFHRLVTTAKIVTSGQPMPSSFCVAVTVQMVGERY